MHTDRSIYAICGLLFLLICTAGGTTPVDTGENYPALKEARNNPQALVRTVMQKELADTYGTRRPLRYRLNKITEHTNTTKEIIETKDGGVACLIATNGRPLTPEAWQTERERLQHLRSHPALQEHRGKREQSDIARVKTIIRALPDAFRYTFAGVVATSTGPAIRLTFEPNPAYSPPNLETRVLRGVHGELWIDMRQERMLRFDARLFEDVDFGWGLVGKLDKGGTVLIEQAEVTGPLWALTQLRLSLTGRALLVKQLRFQVKETAADYQRTEDGLSYKQAIDIFLQEKCGAPTSPPPENARHQQ